jgi:uncharacterized delta-60 repeat protein
MWLFIIGKTRGSHSGRRVLATRRLCLEVLEDRSVPSAGALDPTFGNGAGYVTTSTSSGGDNAHAVLLQPDGKIVAVGKANLSAGSDAAVDRYNPDGSLDASFGSGGIALTSFGPTFGPGGWAALYPSAGTANDGKIVQEGMTYGTNGQYGGTILARYNTNGSLDTSFGTAGEVTTSISSADAGGVVVTSAGQIVALATGGANQVYLVRYNVDGSLDSSFGQGGEVITPTFDPFGGTLLQQPDGKLIAAIAANSPSASASGVDLIR